MNKAPLYPLRTRKRTKKTLIIITESIDNLESWARIPRINKIRNYTGRGKCTTNGGNVPKLPSQNAEKIGTGKN